MTVIRPRTARALAAAAVLGPVLTACGGSGGTAASGAAASRYDTMPVSRLATAAAKEGAVTFYTSFSSDNIAKLVTAFNKQYPHVKVNVLRLSPDKILPRVVTEQRAGTYNADVVSGDSTDVGELKAANALAPYTPKDQAPLPKGLQLPHGYTGVIYLQTTAIAYNPGVVARKKLPVPTGYRTLTDPRWKGQFSIDPHATNWYDSLIRSLGHAAAYRLLKDLGANKPVLTESHSLAVSQLQAGEPAGTATAYGYRVAALQRRSPGSVALVNTDPLPTALNLVDLAGKAPHPAAARLLENWLVSHDGQQAIAGITGQISLRQDVDKDPGAWDTAKWKPVFSTPILSSAAYNTEVAEMRTALGAP